MQIVQRKMFYLPILGFLIPLQAFALLPRPLTGGMDSGGGRGRVCFSDENITEKVRKAQGFIEDQDLDYIVSIEPLDLHEAKQKRGLEAKEPTLAQPRSGENHLSYLARLLDRLDESFPALAQKVRVSEQEFSAENLIWQDVGLLPVMDENTVGAYNSLHCTLTTMAVQYKEEGQNYLAIDQRLFYHPEHSTMGRAVLILHEYLYLVARKLGRADSRSTRLAISLLLRNDSDLHLDVMEKTLSDLNFILPEELTGIKAGRPLLYPILSDT